MQHMSSASRSVNKQFREDKSRTRHLEDKPLFFKLFTGQSTKIASCLKKPTLAGQSSQVQNVIFMYNRPLKTKKGKPKSCQKSPFSCNGRRGLFKICWLSKVISISVLCVLLTYFGRPHCTVTRTVAAIS